MHDVIKEKFDSDYLRKCDIRSYSTRTELKCKNGFTFGFVKRFTKD